MNKPALEKTVVEEITSIRRDIHAHPELSYEEVRTSSLVAEKLKSWGIEVVTNIGVTGVVASISNGNSKRAIGLRADMDALPLQELNDFSHRSTYKGKMHACGHDGHVAMLLGAAYALQQNPEFDGTVNFIFQPAEEGGGGALKMIEDGLFKRFPCDAVYALHNWPGLAAGELATRIGPIMASTNEFQIRVIGKGGHAAMPNLGADPLLAAAQLVNNLQGIISRNVPPVEAAVLSVTQFHAGGDATNIIPNEAVIGGTVRTFTLEVLDLIEKRMQEVATAIAQAHECTIIFEFNRNYPPTINTANETELALRVMQKIAGDAKVNGDAKPSMGAEDFAYMLLEKPGCYVFIGNGEGDHRLSGHGLGPCMLHNPSYDFNDNIIALGIEYWTTLVKTYLAIN